MSILTVQNRHLKLPEMKLTDNNCSPKFNKLLDKKEIENLRKELGEKWHVSDINKLIAEFSFPDFASAMDFAIQVGTLSDKEGHHPDVHISWGKVKIQIWTHVANGLTLNDFILASKIEQV